MARIRHLRKHDWVVYLDYTETGDWTSGLICWYCDKRIATS